MKTLTDIARGIAHQAEQTPNADIDELCENYVTNRQEEVLAAYLVNPNSSTISLILISLCKSRLSTIFIL